MRLGTEHFNDMKVCFSLQVDSTVCAANDVHSVMKLNAKYEQYVT